MTVAKVCPDSPRIDAVVSEVKAGCLAKQLRMHGKRGRAEMLDRSPLSNRRRSPQVVPFLHGREQLDGAPQRGDPLAALRGPRCSSPTSVKFGRSCERNGKGRGSLQSPSSNAIRAFRGRSFPRPRAGHWRDTEPQKSGVIQQSTKEAKSMTPLLSGSAHRWLSHDPLVRVSTSWRHQNIQGPAVDAGPLHCRRRYSLGACRPPAVARAPSPNAIS